MYARLLVEHQQRYGGDGLGHRVDAGDEVALPRPLGFDVGVPGAVEKGDFSVARDEHRTGRPAPGVGIALHPGLQSRQPRLVEAEPRGITNRFAAESTHRANVLSALWPASVYERLKPGGSYVIVDHAAAVGAGTSDAQSLHRIEPASVREEVEAAGFVLDAESTMLANKDDPHSIKVFDPSIKGETDRFAYRFVKP
jgi:hypothetical protein